MGCLLLIVLCIAQFVVGAYVPVWVWWVAVVVAIISAE
jgi:hypothetical protein